MEHFRCRSEMVRGEIKLSWKSRQILGRKFPANLHFRASTNVCQFLQIQIYYYTNRITSTWTIIRQLCNSGSQHFFFASLAKNIEEITMIIEYCTKMKMICTYDTLKWFQSALNSQSPFLGCLEDLLYFLWLTRLLACPQ